MHCNRLRDDASAWLKSRPRCGSCCSSRASNVSSRRFPPPWTVEETAPCFIVRDHNGRALDNSTLSRRTHYGSDCIDLDQCRGRGRCNRICMVNERACVFCTELVRKGEDFLTVWTSVLNSHALVNGLPESKLEGKRPVLEIKLITGERLVFDSESKKFRDATLSPQATLIVAQGSGHDVQIDRPQTVIDALRRMAVAAEVNP